MLVNQDRCRGWRMCVSGCPYKKTYFNRRTGKAEKCTLCSPASRSAIRRSAPTPASAVSATSASCFTTPTASLEAASTKDEDRPLRGAAPCVPRPERSRRWIRAARARTGSRGTGWSAAQRSPVYRLRSTEFQVALPLHPEYRTLPMVWYIPPLSPVVDVVRDTGHDAEDPGNLFAAIEALRIPVEYLAELFTAGDVGAG